MASLSHELGRTFITSGFNSAAGSPSAAPKGSAAGEQLLSVGQVSSHSSANLLAVVAAENGISAALAAEASASRLGHLLSVIRHDALNALSRSGVTSRMNI
jgi:hypothetical protein